MKYILLFFTTLFLFSNKADLKKIEQPYWSVIFESDLIIDGTITDLNEVSYNFQVTDFLKGKDKKKISVNLWKEWTCDIRGKKLKKKQRLILFLKKEMNGSYSVINGSTGELIVTKNKSIASNYYHEYPGVNDVKYGIDKFLNSFNYKEVKDIDNKLKHSFEKKINEEEIKKIMDESSFFKYIISDIKKRKIPMN